MAANSDGSGSDGADYITRGAWLKCDCGSHPRHLNIPEDHGCIIETKDKYRHPFVGETDCKTGVTENIDYFGICSKMTQGETIALQPFTMDENEKPGAPVQGIKCVPVFPKGKWEDTKEDVFIKDGADLKAVTMNSVLVCGLGGRITPASNGLEYKGEKDS